MLFRQTWWLICWPSSLFKIHTINSNQIGAIGEVLSEWVLHIEIFIHFLSNLFLYEPRHYHCDINDISLNAMWIVRFLFKRANYGDFRLERNVLYLLVKENFSYESLCEEAPYLKYVINTCTYQKMICSYCLGMILFTHSFINDRIIINRKG